MSTRVMKVPGPDHPIAVARAHEHVTVSVAGRRIADTRNALSLKEASYPPVYYIPREDVDMTQLQRSSHQTYCPYKGECTYYSIPAGGERSVDAVWSYEEPFAAVLSIARYMAFYPDRVEAFQAAVEG